MSDKDVLIYIEGPQGVSLPVKGGDVVGRDAVGREHLAPFEGISRRHVQFFYDNGIWSVVDLGSKNGTSIDGRKIPTNQRIPVRHGQSIRLSRHFEAWIIFDFDEAMDKQEEACVEKKDERVTMAIMFVDLQGSTDYFQEKGTIVARDWIHNFYGLLSRSVEASNGRHIKNIGDSILAVFPTADDVCMAAVKIQRSVHEHNRTAKEDDRYYLRIGINIGKVVFEDNDIFGNSVNIASRIQNLTPPGKIYMSKDLCDSMLCKDEFKVDIVSYEKLRGIKEKVGICELVVPEGDSPG